MLMYNNIKAFLGYKGKDITVLMKYGPDIKFKNSYSNMSKHIFNPPDYP